MPRWATIRAAITKSLGRQFHDRVSLSYHTVPDGYFSIFKELADMTVMLIRAGADLGPNFIPDISVGVHWARYWKDENLEVVYGERKRYAHSYPNYFPQAASNPQDAFCYPDDALGEFRKWVREHYYPTHMPPYISKKVAERAIPAPAAVARVDPAGAALVCPRHRGEWRIGALDLAEALGELAASGEAEAGAGLAGEDQLAAIVVAEQQRAELPAALVRSHPAADDELLAVEAFHLQPILGPARAVGCPSALGDDAFEAELARLGEELRPLASQMIGIADRAVDRQTREERC